MRMKSLTSKGTSMNCSADELDAWMDIFSEVRYPIMEKAFKLHSLSPAGKFFPKPCEIFNQVDSIRVAIFSKLHAYREGVGSLSAEEVKFYEDELEVLQKVCRQKYEEGDLNLNGFI